MIKILGQRSIGTIHPLDFLFGIIIGDVIGEPLSSGEIPLSGPIAAAALIAGIHFGLSYIALKTPNFRRVIEDEPIVLIEKGRILPKQLQKTKITIESLLMDLRLNSAADLTEVDYAVLESNGQISVIKKTQEDSATPSQLRVGPYPDKGYPTVLIMDGKIVHDNVSRVGTVQWLKEQLRKYGLDQPSDVFLMTMDESGQIYVSKK